MASVPWTTKWHNHDNLSQSHLTGSLKHQTFQAKQNRTTKTKLNPPFHPARSRIVFIEQKRQHKGRRWSDSGLGCKWFHNTLQRFASRIPHLVTSGPLTGDPEGNDFICVYFRLICIKSHGAQCHLTFKKSSAVGSRNLARLRVSCDQIQGCNQIFFPHG